MTDVTTARLRVPTPEPLDLIDATQVSDLIAETSRELGGLEREARELTDAAEQAEAAARMVNVDAASTTWTLVRLQRFLDDLRSEARRDAVSMVEVARQHAQIRIEDARAMAARGELTRPADRVEVPMPIVPPPASTPVAAPPPAAAPPIMRMAPVTAAGPEPVPATAPGVMAESPIIASPILPAPSANPATPTVAPAPVAMASPVVPMPFVANLLPAVPEPGVPGAVAAQFAPPTVGSPLAAPEPALEPAPAKPVKARKKQRGLLPLSAVLEVLAVVLLLAFIVMRLS